MKTAFNTRVDDRVKICPTCRRGYEYGITGYTGDNPIKGFLYYPKNLMPALGKIKKICGECLSTERQHEQHEHTGTIKVVVHGLAKEDGGCDRVGRRFTLC